MIAFYQNGIKRPLVNGMTFNQSMYSRLLAAMPVLSFVYRRQNNEKIMLPGFRARIVLMK
jgi:hypothetical protein